MHLYMHLYVYIYALPCSSNCKKPACDAGDQGLIPGLGSSSGGTHTVTTTTIILRCEPVPIF